MAELSRSAVPTTYDAGDPPVFGPTWMNIRGEIDVTVLGEKANLSVGLPSAVSLVPRRWQMSEVGVSKPGIGTSRWSPTAGPVHVC